jgi:hypothetical protein
MRSRPKFPEEIEALHKHIEKWRATRPNRRTPMPERLWQTATRFAVELGVHAVATKLGLNAGRLKQRVAASRPAEAMAFVEVPRARVCPSAEHGLEVEISNSVGEKLLIRGANAAQLDLPALTAAFLGRRP